jgi:hypothetical protein
VESQEFSCFVEKYGIFGVVQPPELLHILPRFKMHIPYRLPVCIVDAYTGIADFSLVAIFTRVRIDIV